MKEMKGYWLNVGQWAMPNGTVLGDNAHTDRAQLEELEATLIGILGKEPLPRYVMTRITQGERRWVLNVRRGNDWINVVIGNWSSYIEHTYNSGRTQTIPRVRHNRFFYEVYRGSSSTQSLGGPDRSSYASMFQMLHRLILFCQQRDSMLEFQPNLEMAQPTTDVGPLLPSAG